MVTEISSFGYVNSVNNGAREGKFGLPNGRDDGEYNGVGFVEISLKNTMHNEYLFGMISRS